MDGCSSLYSARHVDAGRSDRAGVFFSPIDASLACCLGEEGGETRLFFSSNVVEVEVSEAVEEDDESEEVACLCW